MSTIKPEKATRTEHNCPKPKNKFASPNRPLPAALQLLLCYLIESEPLGEELQLLNEDNVKKMDTMAKAIGMMERMGTMMRMIETMRYN